MSYNKIAEALVNEYLEGDTENVLELDQFVDEKIDQLLEVGVVKGTAGVAAAYIIQKKVRKAMHRKKCQQKFGNDIEKVERCYDLFKRK